MQSLLRWGIENSDTSNPNAPPVRKDLNPEIIDMILGKPDAVLMKEDMEVAVNPQRSEDERISALDHLEMLTEQIDNANNLEKLNLWRPLNALLTSEEATPEIKVQALWVIGTALQNNPSAQDAYIAYNPLPTLMSFLSPSISSSLQTRSRALYAISGILKHNAPVVAVLDDPDIGGWEKLKASIQDPEIAVRRKTVFLLNALLLPAAPTTVASSLSSANIHDPTSTRPEAPVHPNSHAVHLTNPSRAATSPLVLQAMEKRGLLDAVISSLTSPLPYGEDGDQEGPDVEFEEKGVQLLFTYAVTCDGDLSPAQKGTSKSWFSQEAKDRTPAQLAEHWGLALAEVKSLQGRVV
ncbi:nucleotide exchange factors-like protein [Pluteus cervinus]|uniref:Nucleotide exchange factors-like protein n=1 Tax=Pluteus cervinus TaxID=181527 RepID=A0ACD3AZ05_9AGAR|nr:nucleotide exchange factors-like protein [Pluteus cervinus]